MMPAVPPEQWHSFGPFSVDFAGRQLERGGKPLHMEPKLFEILERLLSHPGEVVTYEEFEAKLWPGLKIEVRRNINTQVNKLRNVLGEPPGAPFYILTKHGHGYYFNAAVPVTAGRAASAQPGGSLPDAVPPVARQLPAEGGNGSLAAVPTLVQARPSRRLWLRAGAAAAVAIGGWTAASTLSGDRYRPVSGILEGPTLKVFGSGKRVLWSHEFPELVGNGPTHGHVLVADIDGDGHLEVTCGYFSDGNLEGMLACFGSQGEFRWSAEVGKTVVSMDGKQYAKPYMIDHLKAMHLPGERSARIVVVSVHQWGFPCQVAVVNADSGKLISEYWHRGHLRAIEVADIDGDGRPELLLAGVNDAPEHKQATMVIFDGFNISGSETNPQGQRYFREMAEGTERHVVFFPRTLATVGYEFNIAFGVKATSERIIVNVAERGGDKEENPARQWSIYEFDHSLRVTNLALSYDLQQLYARAATSGAAPVTNASEIDRLRRSVQIIRRRA